MAGKLPEAEQRLCVNDRCRKTFLTRYKDKRFCTNKCRIDQWNRDNPRMKRQKINGAGI